MTLPNHDPSDPASRRVDPVVSGDDDRIGDDTAADTDPDRSPQRPPRRRLSEILTELARDPAYDRISIADLLTIMRGRALAALLLIFAAPNVLPSIPGMSAILGLPLIYLSAQLMLGKKPWLPKIAASRSFSRADFAAMVDRAAPLLARAERLLRPRLPALVHTRAEPVIGAICLILACVIALPIPLGNMLPAFALSLLALGLLERDGLWIIIGTAVGALSLVIVAGVVYAMFKAAVFIVLNAFG